MEWGYRLEVSVASGDEVILGGKVDAFGDGNRIVAVGVDSISQHVADVVAACR